MPCTRNMPLERCGGIPLLSIAKLNKKRLCSVMNKGLNYKIVGGGVSPLADARLTCTYIKLLCLVLHTYRDHNISIVYRATLLDCATTC